MATSYRVDALAQGGLRRLVDGATRHRMAVMCSEENPTSCHRHRLITRALSMGMRVRLSSIHTRWAFSTCSASRSAWAGGMSLLCCAQTMRTGPANERCWSAPRAASP